ncbi:MAG TPA: hypothetical protein VIT92_09760 [Burkholderiaceae bacterium]
MRKPIAAALFTLFCTSLSAQQLADGIHQFDNKQYPQALQTYTRLANEGNAEAQFRLGEMYWYGEGTAIDLTKAKTLFEQAGAQGHASAKAALNRMTQRAARRADIDFYTTRFDGGDLKTARAACVRPSIPEVSQTGAQIKATSDAIAVWNACYRRFGDQLAASAPIKAIPADVLALMNDAEIQAATRRIDQAYAAIATEMAATAAEVVAQNNNWAARTEKFVATMAYRSKAEINSYEAAQRQQQENMLNKLNNSRTSTPGTSPTRRF